MAATVLRHIVRFNHDSGLAQDAVINVWHTTCPDGTTPLTSATNAAAALVDFYTGVHSGSTATVSSYLSSLLDGTWSIRSYDLADPEPRTPILTTVPTAFTPASNSLPTEVALCISFSRTPASGVNMRRSRGRIYIGPISGAVGAADPTTGRPGVGANGLIPTLRAAGAALLAASNASVSWKWAVYSPTSGGAANVQQGYVDNAWDTQRRRGSAPTSRSTF